MQTVSIDIVYYIYILFYGVYVSMKISIGRMDKKEWRAFCFACPLLLLMQGIGLQFLGLTKLRMIYPLITHLPMLLILMWGLKARWEHALIAVITSYSLCQLTRWIGLVLGSFKLSGAALLMIHLALSQLSLLLLARYCLPAMHSVISGMSHPLLSFGAFPLIYYLFDYFTLFTGGRYSHVLAISELLPTALVLFFVLFAVVYRREMEKRRSTETLANSLELRLSSAKEEIHMLRMLEEQTAVYRHDLRHHLRMLSSMLSSDKISQAQDYIAKINGDIENITPAHFCENESVNLLLGAFLHKASACGVRFRAKTALPPSLNIPEPELCAMLSNGLENALTATAEAGGAIDFFCSVRQNKLLIEIKNPYTGEITMDNHIPVSKDKPHGYGCRSIYMIAQRHNGICSFSGKGGIFTLQIAIPLHK